MTSFQEFHEEWHEQLRELVRQMNKAARCATNQEENELYRKLIQRVTSHSKEYYRVKSLAAKNDVLYVFTAPWSNSLERSLNWISGWRPTTAFHIIYSESGILFESHIADILNGCRNGDLGDLSSNQLSRFSELQCEDSANEISGSMDAKMERLVGILERADQLRLTTLDNLLQLLTARQAVEFLIAAAHLLFGIRTWGVNHDRQRSKG
ncbi:hypothetical protein HAX54_049461 [Datura stramonium]|uniref:DOG1 domain-containing protein n=1 Tax=Datura stramonium TaxID=4076 RepID=A0ABS8SUY5_DATST|nr:hypothetical protein [Datura stramonium]